MQKTQSLLLSPLIFWLVGAAACLWYLSPLFISSNRPMPLRFGVDLVGGTYISLIVDTDKAIEDSIYERAQSLKEELARAQIEAPASIKTEKKNAILTFANTAAARAAAELIKDRERTLTVEQKQEQITLAFTTAEENFIKHAAIEGDIHVLESRLNKFSVSEVTVAAQGERNILVELPNIQDPEKAKAMIGKTAMLEFALVQATGNSQEELLEQYGDVLPEGMRILAGRSGAEDKYYLVPRHVEVTGKMLRNAKPGLGEYGDVVVQFELSPEGGRKFKELSRRNIGKRLAIVLDNEVISAPVLQSEIGASGQISGNFTLEKAKDLSDLLKSGAYSAPVKFDEERTIGPALGAQAIRQGILACLVGLGLLFLFCVGYYKIPGLFAFITLIYNLILTLVLFSYFGGTLTLPGIAGLVLTLGMAIDASILIYERIKDELRQGVAFKQAVDTGFKGALSVILDANATHFIMDVVLFKFGSGPIQGFALTMIVGIVTTLVTGLFFLRSLFNFTNRIGVHALKF